MAHNTIRVGHVEILSLSDGILEFDLCNFFPTIPQEDWQTYTAHLTPEHHVRLNLGSYLIRADGRTILVDTGMGPRPLDAPDMPWGKLLDDFQANGVRPEEVDMVVMTHLHRDHVGWNLLSQNGKYAPTFPNARYWMSVKDWKYAISLMCKSSVSLTPRRVSGLWKNWGSLNSWTGNRP